MQPQPQNQDLVNIQQKIATLDQLISNYNQLYKTYLQQIETEMNKRDQRKYPYTIKNPNEFGNTLTPSVPFPSNGTEDACFKSCIDNNDCVYALYSNSGCGIDCNPNKCLLYGANADGIVPVKEVPSVLPKCPVSGDATGTDAWCKVFNDPITNAVIPSLVIRKGGTDWRSLAVQMPKSTNDTNFLTTNVQMWYPDGQFADIQMAPANEISLQFRYFAEYWLNAYNIPSGSTIVIAGQGVIGTFAFTKLSANNTNNSSSYVGTFGGQTMFWNSDEPPTGGAAAGLQTAAALASNAESAKFNYNYSAFEKPVWKVTANMNAMMGQIPPQVAKISVPSWQFLGVQDSAAACQTAAMNDPDYVYTMATYYNASYNNPKNGNDSFARACYGHVAGAPPSTVASVNDDNVQTMMPPYGYTKLGGKNGIAILKKMYQLNKQIMALTDDLKISVPPPNSKAKTNSKMNSNTNPTNPTKEGFTNKNDKKNKKDNVANDDDTRINANKLSELSKKLKRDEAMLNKKIQAQEQLDIDEMHSKRLLMYSRIKLVVAIAIGLFMGYLAYRFLTADNDLPNTIQEQVGATTVETGSSGADMNADMNANMSTDMDMDMDMSSPTQSV